MAKTQTQTHRQLMIQGLFLFASTLMGCSLFQGGMTGKPADPEPAPPIVTAPAPAPDPDTLAAEIPEPADTVADLPDPELDPMPGGPKLESYRVALLLPFLANRFDTFDLTFRSISRWSMQYYMGTQLAAEGLADQGMTIAFDVYDTEGSPQTVEALLEDPSLQEANLILGPYRRVTLQQVAEFAKDRQTNMVSPYSAASNLTVDNPHYLQARPSMRTHCARLVEHAVQQYRPEQVVLVGRNREIDRAAMSYFQEGYYTWAGTRRTPGLMEYTVDSETADYEEIDVYPFIDTTLADTTVFIVSAWTDEDETFVYSLLREIEVARQGGEMGAEENTVVVYGTPAWTDYERTPLDYFRKFNLHLSSSTFIDREDPEVRDFQRSFFDRYGLLPTEEAFLGYDLMNYFGQMLYDYGPAFQNALELEPRRGLHTAFDFQRVVPEGSRSEDFPPVQQYENRFVHILRFSDYAFQPVTGPDN